MAIRLNGIDTNSTLNVNSDAAHGTYVLADRPELFEPQRTNNFEFVVTDLDNIMRAGVLGNETNATIENAQELLRLSVVSAPIPHYTQSVIEIKRGNSIVKVAGTPTFANGQLVCRDFIGAETKAILMAWQNLSYNVATEKVGLMSDYKKDAYLIEYTPDQQVPRRWRLHGCWISGISESGFSAERNEVNQVTVTIEFDRGEIDTSDIV